MDEQKSDINGSGEQETTPREPVWRIARPQQTIYDWESGVRTIEREAPETPRAPESEPAPASPSGGRDMRKGMVAVFLAALIGAVVGSGSTLVATNNGNTGSGIVKVAPPVQGSASQGSVASVAAAVMPSIVRIDVAGQGRFGQSESGTGSGVIYRSDGYIITNDHVVAGAQQVEVRLADGTVLPATVVGSAAPAVDIAVVKVNKTGMKAATFGSIKDLQVGALAVAIGSPFGLQGTVTAGVISALHRNVSLDAQTRFTDAIQTDAPINPGNSGGALADGEGRVIGINTAILSGGAGGNVGVGFAIPIDIARSVTDQIIETGSARLPFIGVSGTNLQGNGGALIQEVVPGGPAARAGLRAGDIIVALDGQKITSMDDLIGAIIGKKVGASVKVEFLRDGKRQTANARLAEKPEG